MKDGGNQYNDDNNNGSDESGNNNGDDDCNNYDLSKLGYFKIEKQEKGFSMTYLKTIMIESFKIRIF